MAEIRLVTHSITENKLFGEIFERVLNLRARARARVCVCVCVCVYIFRWLHMR